MVKREWIHRHLFFNYISDSRGGQESFGYFWSRISVYLVQILKIKTNFSQTKLPQKIYFLQNSVLTEKSAIPSSIRSNVGGIIFRLSFSHTSVVILLQKHTSKQYIAYIGIEIIF